MRSRKLAPLLGALLPALSAGLTVLGATSTAKALPLVTISGSARGLYGSPTKDDERNPYGAGLGLRLGVSLPMSLYLGGSFDYFFGGSDRGALQTAVSASMLQLMGRAGYDLGFGPVTLRPQLGFGLSRTKVELGDVDTNSSSSDFVLAPGIEFAIGFGLLSVGAEASYNAVLADGASDAVVLGLGIGFSI